MKAGLLAALCALALPAASALGQERCGLARDLVARALERITAPERQDEVEDALQLVKHAIERCPASGDAWYYRSLFERKLKRIPQAEFALRQARAAGSEALANGADPFRLSSPPGEPPSKVVREKWALVVGIGKFRDRGAPPLRYTAKDARDFAATLVDERFGRFRPDHVKTLFDADATTSRIKQELNWLARSAEPDDLVVVFVSSHGSPRDMDTAGANYIVTHDTEVDDPDRLYATALPMVDLAEVLRTRVRAKRAAVFLDTCHSGAALASLKPAAAAGPMLDRMRQGAGRVIIASSQVNEQSWESDKLGNGYFTYFLLQALRQGKGMTPVADLFRSLRDHVAERVQAEVRKQQTPVMSRSEEGAGAIVLGVAPGAAMARLR